MHTKRTPVGIWYLPPFLVCCFEAVTLSEPEAHHFSRVGVTNKPSGFVPASPPSGFKYS